MISAGNRRRHHRVPLRVPVGIATNDRIDVIETQTVDVSLGGVCVQGSAAVDPGTEVVVVITAGDRIIPARAKVVRRTAAPELVGLEFLRITPGPRRTLRTWLGEPTNGSS